MLTDIISHADTVADTDGDAMLTVNHKYAVIVYNYACSYVPNLVMVT